MKAYKTERFKRTQTTKYLDMFGENHVHIESDDFLIAVFPNQYDDFKFFSYVNGLDISKGGTHIDYITRRLVYPLQEKLKKKHKNIKVGDIKNKLFLLVMMKKFPDLQFDSQSKEMVTNSSASLTEYFSTIEWEKFVKKILSNKSIVDPIVEIFKLKEELKLKQDLKKIESSPKKIRNEKFLPATKEFKYVFLTEGDSAAGSISRACGREYISYFAMFGVPVNALDSSLQKLVKSQKIKEICEITGISLSKEFQDGLTHSNIVFATDADLPGFNIQCLLMGFFYRFGRHLFNEERIHNFKTPLFVIKNKDQIVDWFYSFDAFNENKSKYEAKKYTIEYKKGLGSFDQSDLEYIIEQDGFETMLETIVLDGKDDIEKWIKSEYVDFRKEKILESEFSILSL